MKTPSKPGNPREFCHATGAETAGGNIGGTHGFMRDQPLYKALKNCACKQKRWLDRKIYNVIGSATTL
jgi:hypothetical protein